MFLRWSENLRFDVLTFQKYFNPRLSHSQNYTAVEPKDIKK